MYFKTMDGRLIIISAPSGAGKTTVCNHLLESSLGLEFSISATTRKKRGKETNGVEYFFMTPEEFEAKIKEGAFVEWEEVYTDLRYGTLKDELERIWSNSHHVLFDVDVKGGVNLKNIFGPRALSLFIMPPSVEELEKRLVKRGWDCPSTINMRVAKAMEELSLADSFDFIIVNDDLEKAKKETREAVSSFPHLI